MFADADHRIDRSSGELKLAAVEKSSLDTVFGHRLATVLEFELKSKNLFLVLLVD
jgi:hypothetical protein